MQCDDGFDTAGADDSVRVELVVESAEEVEA